jgi:hypothetical protein
MPFLHPTTTRWEFAPLCTSARVGEPPATLFLHGKRCFQRRGVARIYRGDGQQDSLAGVCIGEGLFVISGELEWSQGVSRYYMQ